MKIYIMDKEYEFDNTSDEVENIVSTIYRESNKKGCHLAYTVIDGLDVHGNFRDYIESNIESIEKIKVVTMTFSEMISSSIISIKDYIEEERGNVYFIANRLNKEIDEDAIRDLDGLLEGIGWIIEYFQRVDSTQNLNHVIADYYVWNEYAFDVYRLGDIISKLEKAIMKEEDENLGPILESIVPIFDSMSEKLDRLYSAGL